MDNSSLQKLADRLLAKIRNHPGHEYNSEKLAKSFKVEAADIQGAVTILKRMGYVLKSDHGKKLVFVSPPDRLFEEEILHGLKTRKFGRKIHAYQSVQSTNTIAHQLALAGIPEGTIVIAEKQTRGRGRMGRRWHSPEKVGIYMSLVIYPQIDPKLAPGLSLMTAVALAEAIEKFGFKQEVKIKWPNDVLIGNKKTAGILTELSGEIGRTHHVVIGIGINVNQKSSDIPEDLKNKATSLRIAGKKMLSRVSLVQEFLLLFEKEYGRFRKSGLNGIRKKILSYSSLLGKRIKITSGKEIIEGNAIDINGEGHLVVETPSGVRLFNAGEVTLS